MDENRAYELGYLNELHCMGKTCPFSYPELVSAFVLGAAHAIFDRYASQSKLAN